MIVHETSVNSPIEPEPTYSCHFMQMALQAGSGLLLQPLAEREVLQAAAPSGIVQTVMLWKWNEPAFCSLLNYYWPAIPRNHICDRSTLSNGLQLNPLRCRHRPSSTMWQRLLLRTIGGVVRARTKAMVTSVGSALPQPTD